jgi:fructose-1,6-bisphosphatase II
LVYMQKLAVGPEAKDTIDIDAPISDNLSAVAREKGYDIDDLTVVMLDRPRHEDFARQIREAGARIRFITDGDVSGAIMTCRPESGIDVLIGIGGTPEGVLAAAAMKCMGGQILGKLHARNPKEEEQARQMGYDLDRVLDTDDLCSGEEIFFAITGITDGELVQGVQYTGTGCTTHSLVMRSKTGTVREIIGTHRWDKLMAFSEIQYDRIG